MAEGFPSNSIGSPFIELQSVDSTNNYARQQIQAAGLPDRQRLISHGQVYFAHEQFQGKGQRGRIWASEPGANIAMSVLVDPRPLLISQQFELSACVAVAVHEFFMNYAGNDSRIKWPNDLYWQDRKAGGILIESVVGSRDSLVNTWRWAIAGIGININQTSFDPSLTNPVSLKQLTGKNFEPLELAKLLCRVLNERYEQLMNNGFEAILSLYNNYLYKKGEKVKLKKDNRVFEATIKEVNSSGKLVTEHAIEEEFDFGQIEWLI